MRVISYPQVDVDQPAGLLYVLILLWVVNNGTIARFKCSIVPLRDAIIWATEPIVHRQWSIVKTIAFL